MTACTKCNVCGEEIESDGYTLQPLNEDNRDESDEHICAGCLEVHRDVNAWRDEIRSHLVKIEQKLEALLLAWSEKVNPQ